VFKIQDNFLDASFVSKILLKQQEYHAATSADIAKDAGNFMYIPNFKLIRIHKYSALYAVIWLK